MSLIKYRPARGAGNGFPTLFAPWDTMDQLLEGFVPGFWKDAPKAMAGSDVVFQPPVDITQDGARVTLRAELPGVKKEDVEITVHENTLTLKGSKKTETIETDAEGKEAKGSYRYVERRYGEFLRTFTLSDSVDTDHAEAEFNDGVLEIRLPILEAAKPRKIEIHSN